jgi:hypothetical protein
MTFHIVQFSQAPCYLKILVSLFLRSLFSNNLSVCFLLIGETKIHNYNEQQTKF